MSDGWIDNLPSQEREKIKKRMRSPAEYAKLRDKVKGPEDLEKEMSKNAEFAEVKLSLETDPKSQESAKEAVKSSVAEHGMEQSVNHLPSHAKEMIEKGQFDVTVDASSKEPKLAVRIKQAPKNAAHDAPSGNVSEVYSLKPALQQQIMSSFLLKGGK